MILWLPAAIVIERPRKIVSATRVGQIDLAGTLNLSLIDGFQPTAGVFEVLTYGSRSGEFSSVDFAGLPAGLLYDLVFDDTAGSAVVVITTPGDADRNGLVDAADLAQMLAFWGTDGSLLNGDFDLDGVIGPSDLGILFGRHNQPTILPDATTGHAGLAAVPEPSSTVLVLCGVVGLLGCGRRRRR